MHSYSQLDSQLKQVLLLSEDDIIAPAMEAREFLGRFTQEQIRNRVCQEYELGLVDAKKTIARLADNDLFGSAETFMEIFLSGVKASDMYFDAAEAIDSLQSVIKKTIEDIHLFSNSFEDGSPSKDFCIGVVNRLVSTLDKAEAE